MAESKLVLAQIVDNRLIIDLADLFESGPLTIDVEKSEQIEIEPEA